MERVKGGRGWIGGWRLGYVEVVSRGGLEGCGFDGYWVKLKREGCVGVEVVLLFSVFRGECLVLVCLEEC